MQYWSWWKRYVVVPLSIREYIQFEVGAQGQIILLRNDKTSNGEKILGYYEKRGVIQGLSMSCGPVIITWIVGLARRSMFSR
jgi:hypothetical protein